MAIYSGITHQKWLFSIAILVYQRVSSISSKIANVEKHTHQQAHIRWLGVQPIIGLRWNIHQEMGYELNTDNH